MAKQRENAMQSVQKQTRIIKLATKRNHKCKMGVAHPCFPWMVEYCVDLFDEFAVGKDGLAFYDRTKRENMVV